ncbi:magnesium transporter [Putridiphycobacter roseus]|uniref:Magnesium transporter MgtE n=1 Tax=Putridiphycobacter roseus TaxID=2219161 RepID=A0A2W1N9L2_9FLAO|nr:magnesium transporter [Putridiphycobacter roseus]PZE15733.1 magnesium transporter [Putridiphycobacter roseus]
MKFELTKSFIEDIQSALEENNIVFIKAQIFELHPADIADIVKHLGLDEGKHLFDYLDEEQAAQTLVELDEDIREKLLELFSPKEIAEQVDQLDSDDAADLLGELSEQRKDEVISKMEDKEHASEVIDLLRYDEDSAGGLMQSEFVQVRSSFTVKRCIIELRKQAEEVEKVYSIYVVDESDVLLGVLSLKRLLFAKPTSLISELYQSNNIKYVKTNSHKEDVADIMKRYDLIAIPVVDYQNKLVGRITIDDVVDVMQEEAEKDYQLASGITDNVEATASVFKNTKSRLPWILIGLLGGVLSSLILQNYEADIQINPVLAFFIPLITATGGNVGVQSSAIVVQGLASKEFMFKGIFKRILKELLVGVLIGLICGILIFLFNFFTNTDIIMGITIGISIFIVVIIAAIFGTLFPLILNKLKIDPALATGPFVTTTNDILGLSVYFMIAFMLYN